jgi:hypothetical protein
VKISLISLISLWSLSGISATHEITWPDIAPAVQSLLVARGINESNLRSHLAEERRKTQARVREGDLDHLVYYALQSTAFTSLPPIEPAASASADVSKGKVPPDASARVDAFVSALQKSRTSERMSYFKEILERETPQSRAWRDVVAREYLRAMEFFKAPDYQSRGLSTDTSIDAGYVVDLALATLRRLEPERRIRTVLIVGPGLNLAPRTGLVEAAAPQSWQPFGVMDSLLRLGLAERLGLHVVAADINPRVVAWINRTRGTVPLLGLVNGVAESDRIRLTDDYRAYFSALGASIGEARVLSVRNRLAKSVAVGAGVSDAIDAVTLDIVSERLEERFDLVVVTNVFPYLTDADLLLALTNIVSMLAPGGVLLHNEPRPMLADASLALNLPLVHSRSAVIATVEGTRSPLYDAVWMHRAADRKEPR